MMPRRRHLQRAHSLLRNHNLIQSSFNHPKDPPLAGFTFYGTEK
jgi:hypothetical protein